MPRKKPEVLADEIPAEKRQGGYVALKDFEQRYVVEVPSPKGVKEEKHSVVGIKGEAFDLPAEWARDTSFEQIVFMKKARQTGVTFVLPTGKRVTLPVMEA